MTRLVIQEGKREKGREVGDSMELWQVEDSRPPWTAIVVSNLPADIRCRVTRVANAIDREKAPSSRVHARTRAGTVAFHRPGYRIATFNSRAHCLRVQVLPLKD